MPNQDRTFYALKLKRFFLRRICPRRFHRRLPRSITTNALPGSIGRIHTCDTILTRPSLSGLNDYLAVGRSALDNCAATLAAMNRNFSDIRTCLDLPCGHGRILRWLQTRIDPAGITACDIDRAGVDFCREEFGVKGVYSSDDLDQLKFPDSYDLIWVGSLLTHLDPARCTALLRKLSPALRPGGVLVFTTHGESCFTRPGLRAYGKPFRAAADRMKADFQRKGYCYAPYDDTGYYGITLHSEDYIKKHVTTNVSDRLQLVRYQARGWHDHQDVWSFRKM
jgi:SAM-dependent methyltransferase